MCCGFNGYNGNFIVLMETVMMFVAFYGDMLKPLLMEYGPKHRLLESII